SSSSSSSSTWWSSSSSSAWQGEALAFSWACLSGGLCEQLAAAASGDTLLVAGGSLEPGEYRFSVTAARASDGAQGVAEVTVLLSAAASPVVSMAKPPAEVSPQATLALTASSAVSGECVAPEWKAWWLVPETAGSGDPVLLQDSESALSLSFAPPLPVAPGAYVLRLVMSASSGAGWQDLPEGAFAFDSAAFEVDAPPEGGAVVVSPTAGDAALTPFLLSSLYWVDDDLPLMHKFSWCYGGTVNCSASSAVFKRITGWSYDDRFQNMLFASPGLVAVRAEVMDDLGSVSSALGQLTVRQATEAPSSEAILGLVGDIAATGNSYALLAAVEAVAPASGGSSWMGSLLDQVEVAGGDSLADPSPESVAATASAINTVIGAGSKSDSGAAMPVDIDVASQAADLLLSSATAATSLEGGLAGDPETTSTILGAVGSLLSSVAPPTTNASESSEDGVAKQALSSQLQLTVDSVGEALLVGVAEGQSLTSSSPTLELTVSKESLDTMAENPTTAGSFTLPAIPQLRRYRRDARDDACGSVGLKHTMKKAVQPSPEDFALAMREIFSGTYRSPLASSSITEPSFDEDELDIAIDRMRKNKAADTK
ncbi:unnamed protein product, partial [Prorocentrum cordatum]